LREDYIEGAGHRGDVDALVRESAPGFAALLRHLARLDAAPYLRRSDLVDYARDRVHLDGRVVGDLLALADGEDASAIDAVRLFPEYLAAMERLAEFVDRWRA
jgi:hypothetical protein